MIPICSMVGIISKKYYHINNDEDQNILKLTVVHANSSSFSDIALFLYNFLRIKPKVVKI